MVIFGDKKYYTVNELSRMLGISTKTLYSYLKFLPHCRLGKRYLVCEDDIKKLFSCKRGV